MKSKEFWQASRTYDTKKAEERYPDFKREIYRNLEIQTWSHKGKPYLRIYSGKSGKPLCYYWYTSAEQRGKSIDNYKESQDWKEERKARNRLARRIFKNPYKVADILYHSWGYEQTNIDFYQVIRTTAKTITIREIAQTREHTGWEQGLCEPIKDRFLENSKPQVKRLTATVSDGKTFVSVSTPYGCLSRWDGQRMHWTNYY